MRPTVLFLTLLAFWALCSGQVDPHHHRYLMSCGVVSCLATVWICRRLGIVDGELVPLAALLRLPRYGLYLLKEVILANWDVFKRVWAGDPPLDPRVIEIPCGLRTDFVRTVYANSITLTPGTVVMEVEPDRLIIHALTAEAADGVQTGAMERENAKLEPKP